jgi:hypothetical protein
MSAKPGPIRILAVDMPSSARGSRDLWRVSRT